jgi:cytoskeletal protein RodZ
MDSIGQELKRARDLKGIPLEEIAETTKINLRFLRWLEEDRFELLPGKFFTRGIIRSYAKFLGLDEKGLMENFRADHPEHASASYERSEDSEEPPVRAKRILSYSILAVFLTVVLVIFLVLLQDKGPEPAPQQEAPVAAFVEEPQSQPPVVEAEPAPRELNLMLAFQQETWIQVYADDALILDTIQFPNQVFQVNAKDSILLNVGNAGGFTFTINGQSGKPLGNPGTVAKNIRITQDNYTKFLQEQ